ncbi:hypothetical protein LTS15_004750 [Exophiala xenobiotica]|nr:hypothetical protein LTS15_004750 [Exophiala xenobiotica]
MAPDTKSTHDSFSKKLKDLTVNPHCNECGGCGRPYIQVEKLRNWLKEKHPEKTDTTWADLCLGEVKQGHSAGSLSLRDIDAQDRECLLVFSILYDIRESSLTPDFQRWGFTDKRLPITLLELQNELKKSKVDASIVAQKFDERQWAFCPTRRGMLSDKGGNALVWQIGVQEEFVGPTLRTMSAKSKFADPDFGLCYQFVLKTFRDGHGHQFKEECDAFWALREHDGMIRYLGDFYHPSDPSCQIKDRNGPSATSESENIITTANGPRDHGGRETNNILLEWGETDLEEFFAKREPPVLGSEVRLFWKELFGVAAALRLVHNFTNKNGQEFDGWHADIKPDNILRVQSRFKLSDPGFAQFAPRKPNNTTRVPGGTSTYGAPEWERSRKTKEPVPQSIDIWSLGCVFSIAATWVALGYKGIQVYERLRETAIKASLGTRQLHNMQNQHDDENRPEADFFHDGSNVLEAIRHWHKAVRQYIRRTDSVTGHVLDLVTNSMLQGSPSQRINATDLCTRLTSILESCPDKPEFDTLPDVQKALNAVQTENERLQHRDVPESSSQKGGPIQGRADIIARKSYNVHMARLRSEYFGAPATASVSWPSASFEQSMARTSQGRLPAHSVASQRGDFDANHPSTSQLGASAHGRAANSQKETSSAQIKRTSTTNQRKPQDVFQARQELEEIAAEENRSISSKLKRMVTPDRKKDPFLAKFFEHRDIVFVADNAGSMVDSWPQATELLDVLVKKAKNLDDNGMDLYFTHTNGKPNALPRRRMRGDLVRAHAFPVVDGKNAVAKFKEAMRFPESKPVPGVTTDMSLMLGFLLDKYINQLKNVGINNAKEQTIIILTDGKWERESVSGVIKGFVEKWEGLAREKVQSRSMGIQFVQFGNDPDATLRLEYLDNKLPFEGVPDIVDTEPSLGDVYKMLIGSFIEEYDERSNLSPSSPAGPEIMFSEHEIQSSPPSLQESSSLQQTTTNSAARLRLPSTIERLPSSMDRAPPD